MLRATFELRPAGRAHVLAPLRGRVVADDGETVVVGAAVRRAVGGVER